MLLATIAGAAFVFTAQASAAESTVLLLEGSRALWVPAAVGQSESQGANMQPLIGGQKAIVLNRVRTGDGSKPEFLSITVLPGRAMNLFQVTAWIPGKGEIELIHSPSINEAAQILSDANDPTGTKNTSFGGAFLVPFANRIVGAPSEDGKKLSFIWNGRPMTLDANWKGAKPGARPHAIHGLILKAGAENVRVISSAGRKVVSGEIHAGDFEGHWFSRSDMIISLSLERDAVTASVQVKNVGHEPEPVGVGWHPYFNLPSGYREQARLHIQGDMRTEVNNYDDVFPTGNLQPVHGTPYDFTPNDGAPLKSLFLDDNWSHKGEAANGSAFARLIDPAAGYGISVVPLSPYIHTIQVYAPVDKPFVAIEPQFNLNDPFGEEWTDKDNGMVTLSPGQSLTWKVKLMLFIP